MTVTIPRISVAVAEVGEQPANLSVHVVQNCEEAARAGCGSLLVPGYEVLACSQDEDEIPHCAFDLKTAEDSNPVFIVPSAARGEEGSFMLFVEGNVPLEVVEVPEDIRNPWKHERNIKMNWCSRGLRPSATMGGGRVAGSSPVLPWYRNPQVRITAAAVRPSLVPDSPGSRSGAKSPKDLNRKISTGSVATTSIVGEKVPAEDELLKIFKRCDKTPDGKITKREFIKACRSEPEIARFFGVPGYVRQEDDTRDRLEEIFQSMDQNHDRAVTWDEFRYFYRDMVEPKERPVSRRGVLMLAILTPLEVESEPAAIHVLRNVDAQAASPSLTENPQLHKYLACSGKPGEEYSSASEVGAVCRVRHDSQSVVIVPSLKEKKCEGAYNLQILATEEIAVEYTT